MPDFQFIYCPDDRAVANNNGRIGASKGPEAFNEQFKKLKGNIEVQGFVTGLDQIPTDKSIEESHRLCADAVKLSVEAGKKSILIGGGHDYAFPLIAGVSEGIEGKVGCFNLDPHFDLREPNPQILSGSPFYMAIENSNIEGENLIEFGIQQHCNAPQLWRYAEKKGVQTTTLDELDGNDKLSVFSRALKSLEEQCDEIILSVDLDSIAAAFAPGVSAPAAEGFSSSEVRSMVQIAAKSKKVNVLGIFELNPQYDIDDRTASLTAILAYHFIALKQ